MGNRILIVDDNAALQMNLRGFLLEEGLEVFQAGNVREALNQCRTHKPDIVLLDIYLPGELGTVLSLKASEDPASYGNPKIIAMSGVVGENLVREGDFMKENNIEFFIKKPFELKDLMLVINRFLDRDE